MTGLLQDHWAALAAVVSTILGPAGATWAVLRWRMKGAEDRANTFEAKLDLLLEGQSDHEKRLFLVEAWITKLPCITDPRKYWEEHARKKAGG